MSNEDLPSINDIVEESNLPSYKDFIEVKEEELLSVEDYISESVEEESLIEEEDIETVLSETAPEWSELVRLVNDVRKDIPEIPEIKYYDEQLKELSDKLSQIQDLNEDKLTEIESKIPELPEVKYYDADIQFIYDKIGRIKEEINSLPEVKYYESDLSSLKSRIEEVNQSIPTFPDWIQEVQEVPDFSWIGKTFSIIDDDFNKVQGHLDLIREKIDYQVSELNETIGKKEFELNIDIKNVDNSINDTNIYLNETKDKIYKELRDSSVRIWEHHKEFKDDDRKLKKSICK
jgi:tetrahydromethanopterin S-methyltransferase subunit G